MEQAAQFNSTIHFYIKNHYICVRRSALTGLVTVKVNDRIVSRQRTWQKRSTHAFELDGIGYDVRIQKDNWRGPVNYILRCQSQPVRHKQIIYFPPGKTHPIIRHFFRILLYIASVILILVFTLLIFNQVELWGVALPLFFISLLIEYWLDKKFAKPTSDEAYPKIKIVMGGADEYS